MAVTQRSMTMVPIRAQLWLLAALPLLGFAATCTSSSGEDPSCHAENSLLQVGLSMSHDKDESTQKDAITAPVAHRHKKEQGTIDAAGLLALNPPPISYLTVDSTSEVGMAIATAVHSNLEELGGRPRLTESINRDALGGRVVYFPAWVWLIIGIFFTFSISHEVYVGCFKGWPLLQNRVPQKSIGLQVLSLWGWMSALMTTAINIPLSLDYTMAMGMDPVLSGFFLSFSCITSIMGMVIGRFLFDDKKWSQRSLRRWIILLPDIAGIMGLVAFYFLQWVAGQPIETRRTYWWTCLGVGQIQTLLASSVGIPSAVIWNKCTPNKDKTFWTMLQQSTKMLGMALGPGVSALVIYAVQGNGERVSPISMQAWMNFAIVAMNFLSGLLGLMYLPVEIPMIDEDTLEVIPAAGQQRPPLQPQSSQGGTPATQSTPPVPVKLEPAPEDLEPEDKEKLVWHTLQFALERPLTVSAVEVATVMILEVEYGWPRESTGIVFFIIACLGTVFALVVAILIKRRSLRETYLVFTSGIISVCASLLLFDFNGSWGMWSLLCADPLLFTLALTSWGICEGWAARAVTPGKWYSIETFRMFDGLLMNLGRTISPLAARALIDVGGRNGYAALQVLIVALGFHSLKSMCSVFWSFEKKMEQQKTTKLQVPDEPKKEILPGSVYEACAEDSPETATEST